MIDPEAAISAMEDANGNLVDGQADGASLLGLMRQAQKMSEVADTRRSIWFVGWGPAPPTTRWGKFKLRMQVCAWRARDAWQVLTGKAWIDDWSTDD